MAVMANCRFRHFGSCADASLLLHRCSIRTPVILFFLCVSASTTALPLARLVARLAARRFVADTRWRETSLPSA